MSTYFLSKAESVKNLWTGKVSCTKRKNLNLKFEEKPGSGESSSVVKITICK